MTTERQEDQRRTNGLLRLLGRTRHRDEQRTRKPTTATTEPVVDEEENEYYTFSKTGELIDVDDDEVVEIQEKVTRDWRAAYLASLSEDDSES